jgi:DNA-binding MarR family transcriptional regulator
MKPENFLKCIEILRKYDPNMQSQTIAIFLYIAIHNRGKFIETGVPMTIIASDLNLAQSSVSRNISILSKWKWSRKEGLDLVETREDPMERRRKLVKLTPKGEKLFLKFNS